MWKGSQWLTHHNNFNDNNNLQGLSDWLRELPHPRVHGVHHLPPVSQHHSHSKGLICFWNRSVHQNNDNEKQMKSTTYDPCVSITFISKVNWKYFQNTFMIIEKVPPRSPFYLSIWKMWLLWFQGRAQLAVKVLQGMMKGEEVNQGGHQGMKRVSGSGRYFGMTYIDLFLLMAMNFVGS